jgi:hypothetical protein
MITSIVGRLGEQILQKICKTLKRKKAHLKMRKNKLLIVRRQMHHNRNPSL